MHTLVSLLALIGALSVLAVGVPILYWNLTVYHVLSINILKKRVMWTIILIFFLIVHLGVWGVAISLHVVPSGLGVGLLFRNVTTALSFVAGVYTMKVVRSYNFMQRRRAVPERLVWALSSTVWPWLIANVIVSFLYVLLKDPLLTTLTELVLPSAALLFFWPIMILGMISATRWVADLRLRQNMRWYVYFTMSLAITVWAGFVTANVLGVRGVPGLGLLVSTVFFPAVIFTTYKSSKFLVMTHKLPSDLV